MDLRPRQLDVDRKLKPKVVLLRRVSWSGADKAPRVPFDPPNVVELAKQPGLLYRLHAMLDDQSNVPKLSRRLIAR